MICKKCKSENPDNAAFCRKCGERLKQQENPINHGDENPINHGDENPINHGDENPINHGDENPINHGDENPINQGEQNLNYSQNFQNPNQSYNQSEVTKKAKIAFFIIIIAAFSIVMIYMRIRSTINLNKYVILQYSGYDGYANATVNIDWEEISKKYAKKIKMKKPKKDDTDFIFDMRIPSVVYLSDFVNVDLDKKENLKNGDKVKYIWNIDQEKIKKYFKCHLKYSEETAEVSGLPEAEKFNPFDDIEVKFKGVSPYGYANFEYNGKDFSLYSFFFDKESNLKNNDKIVLSLREDFDINEYAKKTGKIPSATSKEYTVEGLDEYVSSLSQIDKKDQETIRQNADRVIDDNLSNLSSKEKKKSIKYIGSYLKTMKEPGSGRDKNYYGLVYEINMGIDASPKNSQVSIKYYTDVSYPNLILKPDKSLECDLKYRYLSNASFSEKVIYGDGIFDYDYYYFDGYKSLEELKKDTEKSTYGTKWNVEWNLSGK